MREYRKRKRAVHMSEPLERTPSASTEGARDPWPPIIRKPAPQTKAPDAKLGRRGAIGALKRLWTSRSPFPSGSSLRRCARIATTLATVHPAHGVAIVEVVSGDGVLRSMVGIELGRVCGRQRATTLALSVARWVHNSAMATFSEAPL